MTLFKRLFIKKNRKNDFINKDAHIDFVIIGSGKCGTTSLYSFLDQHPDIFMSKPAKEPHFFWDKTQMLNYWKRRNIFIPNHEALFSEYMLRGYSGEKLLGEASTGYTSALDKNLSTPIRMLNHNKSIKAIYVIRNPHHRILSHYRQDLKMGRTRNLSFKDFLSENFDQYIQQSLYGSILELYLKHFDQKQIHVIIFEEMIDSPKNQLLGVLNFLNLDYQNNMSFHHDNKSSKHKNQNLESIYSQSFMGKANKLLKNDVDLLENILGRKIETWDMDNPFNL